LQQTLVAPSGGQGDHFGFSVTLDADVAVVGAYGVSNSMGAAYAFEHRGSSWEPPRESRSKDATAGARFGFAVAKSGNTAVVGVSPRDDAAGSAYVFERSGDGLWSQEQRLVAPDTASGDSFGASVAISGKTAAVGAQWKDGAAGAAYVFARDAQGWSVQQEIRSDDIRRESYFGHAVALDGDTLLVGAQGAAAGAGSAYLFERRNATWLPERRLSAAIAARHDAFGLAVAQAGGESRILECRRRSRSRRRSST
jgi:hypothetical protein